MWVSHGHARGPHWVTMLGLSLGSGQAWGHLATILEPSWRLVGDMLAQLEAGHGHLGAILGSSWGHVGAFLEQLSLFHMCWHFGTNSRGPLIWTLNWPLNWLWDWPLFWWCLVGPLEGTLKGTLNGTLKFLSQNTTKLYRSVYRSLYRSDQISTKNVAWLVVVVVGRGGA